MIFSHASEEMRVGALDFDQLTERQKQSLRNQLAEYRKELASANAAIVRIEEQLRLLQRAFDQAEKTVSDDLKLLGFAWFDLAAVNIKTATLDERAAELATKQSELKAESEKLADDLNTFFSLPDTSRPLAEHKPFAVTRELV